MLGKYEDNLHLQLCLNVCFLIPVDVLCLIIHNIFHIFGKSDILFFGIFINKAILLCYRLQNVIEGFDLNIGNTLRQFVLFLDFLKQFC